MLSDYHYNTHTVLDLFKDGVKKYGNKVLLNHHNGTQWESFTWNQVDTMVKALASYFIDLGLKPGDVVSIYSENRPEWAIADLATLSIGGIDAAIYPTNSAPEAAYILKDSSSVVCVCSSKFQTDNVLSKKSELPNLKKIIVCDDINYNDDMVITFKDAVNAGNKNLHVDEIENRTKNVKPDDVMTLIYTSGTTGDPKGVMLTHKNIMFICLTFNKVEALPEGFIHLSLLPLSHSVERTMDYYSVLERGAVIYYSRGTEYFAEELKEIRPQCDILVPRVFEKIYNGVMAKVKEMPEKKQKIFNWALSVGLQAAPYFMAAKRKPPLLAVKYAVANKLIFSKLKNALGLDRVICWGAAGAPLAKEIHDFFWAMNLQVRKGYGLTETSPVLAVDGSPKIKPIKSDGWICPFPETQIKIADDGEILAKGPQLMKGYLNKPEATKEMFTDDGWIKTGDIGVLDSEGYLKITDRKKDIIVTAGGKNIAPQVIEQRLLIHPFIEQVAIVGDARKYIVALIVPNFETLTQWAATQGISAPSNDELVKHPDVRKKYEAIVNEVNQEFGKVEQIKKFTLLPQQFTQETGELTPTLKIKRKVIQKKYADVIEEMYKE